MKRSTALLEWNLTQRTIVTWISMLKWISLENCAHFQKTISTGCVKLRNLHLPHIALALRNISSWSSVVREGSQNISYFVYCPIFYFYLYSIEWFSSYIIVMKENKKNNSFRLVYFLVLANSVMAHNNLHLGKHNSWLQHESLMELWFI